MDYTLSDGTSRYEVCVVTGLSHSPFCRLRRLGEEEVARTRYCIPQMRGLALRQRASRPLQSPFWRELESPGVVMRISGDDCARVVPEGILHYFSSS